MRFIPKHGEVRVHSVRPFSELLDNQPFILDPPLLHLFVRGHEGADVVGNNSLLHPFVLKGNRVDGQGLESSLYVDLSATGNKYMQIRNLKVQVNEVLDKVKDCLSWGGHPKVGGLIERVHNNENWVLGRRGQHIL
jgi:hypothetical protein